MNAIATLLHPLACLSFSLALAFLPASRLAADPGPARSASPTAAQVIAERCDAQGAP